MKPQNKIEKLITELVLPGTKAADERILNDALAAYGKTESRKTAERQPNVWRKIMNNKTTKFAAAAVIIIAALIGINQFGGSVDMTTPAYAFEQTIEAFNNVRFLHVVRYNESEQIEDERWIEVKADGSQGKYRQDTTDNLLVVDDGITIFVYHRDKNAVLLYGNDGPRYTWISNLHGFFRDLAGDSSVSIEENIEYNGQKAHLVRWLKLNVECYIDPETKLPIALGKDRIFYEQPPRDIFDIPKIPQTVTVVDKRSADRSDKEPDWIKNQELAQKTFTKARSALANGGYLESIELFKEVFQLEGTGRNWAWFWLGQAYYKLGENDSAIEAYSKVIEMFAKHNLTSYETHYARGLAFRADGNEEAAWNDFIIALPVMIDSLTNIQGAGMFDNADDPLEKGNGLTEQQRFDKMVIRLKEIAGESIDTNSNSTKEEIISSWENWWDRVSTE